MGGWVEEEEEKEEKEEEDLPDDPKTKEGLRQKQR